MCLVGLSGLRGFSANLIESSNSSLSDSDREEFNFRLICPTPGARQSSPPQPPQDHSPPGKILEGGSGRRGRQGTTMAAITLSNIIIGALACRSWTLFSEFRVVELPRMDRNTQILDASWTVFGRILDSVSTHLWTHREQCFDAFGAHVGRIPDMDKRG